MKRYFPMISLEFMDKVGRWNLGDLIVDLRGNHAIFRENRDTQPPMS